MNGEEIYMWLSWLFGIFIGVIWPWAMFFFDCLKRPDSPGITMRVNRKIRGAKRSKNVNIEYSQLIDFSKPIDIDLIESWSKQSQLPFRFNKLGQYRYEVKSESRPKISAEIIYHFLQKTGNVNKASITIKDNQRGKEIDDIAIDIHTFGNEISEKLNQIRSNVKSERKKESFRLDLGRAPETQYFLNTLGLKQAEGVTKKGNYDISIRDNFIEIKGAGFSSDELKEIIRLSELA